jgi:thymidine phosphorylase
VGCVIAAQTADLVPADGAVYALRDATATVRSIPLIAASVMAKKLAIGSDLILLDVKAGSGAFMRDPREASQLVDACLGIARDEGRDAAAAISDMSQPLGTAIGNALEIAEAIEVLRGQRTGLLRDLSVWLAARALARLTGTSVESATERAAARLSDGSALESFRAMIRAQQGVASVVDDPWSVLPTAPVQVPISVNRTGFVTGMDAVAVGEVAARLGAGRQRKLEPIDPAVGIVLTPKVGDRIEDGQPIGVVHARDEQQGRAAAIAVGAALTIGEESGERPPMVYAWSEEVG